MKRLIAMLSTGMALGFALALAYADDTARTDSGSSDVTMSQPGTMATSTPGISSDTEMPGTMGTMETPGVSDESGFEQPGQTGDTTMHGETHRDMSKSMDTTRSKKEAARSSKTCTDEAGIIHRSGTDAYTKCMKAKGKTQKEMGGQAGESTTEDMHKESQDMSGESGEKSESSY